MNGRRERLITLIHLNYGPGASVDVRIQKWRGTPHFTGMKWKMIRLELASSWDFPRGSAGRSYLIRLPLTDDGAIDTAALESQPSRATVRRYWPNQADMLGHVVPTPTGYAIRYEMNGSKLNGNAGSNGSHEPRLFQFGADALSIGREIYLTEPDGREMRFKIASMQ